jgi:hypothetical protein
MTSMTDANTIGIQAGYGNARQRMVGRDLRNKEKYEGGRLLHRIVISR